jgi:putative adenylate-forming enzyme
MKMWDTLRFVGLIFRLSRSVKRKKRGQLLAMQEQRWRQMLRHAVARSPFYRRRFAGIDLRTCRPDDLPTVTKAELMANFDDVVTDRRIKLADAKQFLADRDNLGRLFLDRYVVCHTSGTQGQPAVIVQEPRDLAYAFALNLARGHALPKRASTLLGRLFKRTRMAVVTVQPDFNPSGVAFTYMPAGARRYVELLWLSLFDPLEENVAKLNAFQPQYLTGYASVLETLAREQREGRLRLRGRGLTQINNMSEPLARSTRDELVETFGVHVTDNYSTGECMALSSGCPKGMGSHLNVDLAMLEVVDDENRPVPPGTPGSKVLLTNLYNRVQPFIRYEIGDVVTMSTKPCPCGSRLPLITAVNGRTADQFWVQAGGRYQQLSPYLFRAAIHNCLEMAEFQVVQTDRNRFVVKAVPMPGAVLSPERLRRPLREAFAAEGLDDVVDVDVQIVTEIEADRRSGKKRRMRSLVGPPPSLVREADEVAA